MEHLTEPAFLTAAGALLVAVVGVARSWTKGSNSEWRRYTKLREEAHQKDITRLEKKIDEQEKEICEVSQREQACQIKAAQQDREIYYLKMTNENNNLKIKEMERVMAERGMIDRRHADVGPPIGEDERRSKDPPKE